MFGLPRGATLCWLLTVGVGGGLFLTSAAAAAGDLRLAFPVAMFALAGAIAETFGVPMPSSRPGHRVDTTVSSAVYLAVILLFPIHWAVLCVVASLGMAHAVARRSAWFKVAFNAAQIGLTAALAGSVFHLGAQGRSLLAVEATPWLLLAVAVYFLANSFHVIAMVSLASNLSLRLTWWRTYRNVLPAYLGILFVGVLIALLWSTAPWGIAIAVAPLAALYYALRNTVNLETQTIDALFRLADILDDRDAYTHGHSVRVGEYAERLALALGQSGDDAYLVFLAGRLHDIGKSAVKNEVLLKPGPLDAEERGHMSSHPLVGSSMLARFALFREVATYVRSHHERWDGTGYPDGQRGEEIPFGARIIAVADAYDAMTTTRPYRSALPHDEAVRRLREGAGIQWDARVVAAFLQLLEEEGRTTVRPVTAAGAASHSPA